MKYDITVMKHGNEILSVNNFGFEKNKINFIFGESGIGKSLLSKIIFGIGDAPDLEITIAGMDYPVYKKTDACLENRKNGFYVFQEPSTHLNPLKTLHEQLNEGDLNVSAGERDIVAKLFPDRNYDEFNERIGSVYPKTYRPSGGEKQRILLLMAFKKIVKYMHEPGESNGLFIFDEPTGSLDNQLRNRFTELLYILYRRKKFTAVVITHDYSIISFLNTQTGLNHNETDFFELTRKQGMIDYSGFREADYLRWLNTLERPGNPAGNETLRFRGGMNVWGKPLQIIKEGSRSDLVIKKGEIAFLKAPSGTGKTTVAKIITGFIKADSFEFTISGTSFSERDKISKWRNNVWGKKAVMVFQNADESLNQNAYFKDALGGIKSDKKPEELFPLLFTEADIERLYNKRIRQLSGGQKQRLNLIRAFAAQADLYILDEPFSSLDFNSVNLVVSLIFSKLKNGASVLLISHNEEIVEKIVPAANIYHLTTV
ncbi:MAG: ATP-binding cassette domain-containing protein [Ignavibacteriaceae bacterium]|nr:ATP-binding cassette domain-containing protein [Ignavibacteriaceae bacterium]